KSVRYMACLVNLEGQLAALPPPLPPVPTFAFELAQDWSVLAKADFSGGPDVQVMGGKGQGPGPLVIQALNRGPGSRAPGQASAFANFAATTPAGTSLDGAGAM